MGHIKSVSNYSLDCKSWVANEFLDVLTCYDLPEHGLDKFIFYEFYQKCEPFEEEVVTRLASMCTHLSHLKLSFMYNLTE